MLHSQVLFCSPRSEKVKAGLFSSVEEYTIETLPFKYLAKRKFTDFQWLREKLSLDFAGIYVDQRLMQIPPVSSKTFKEAFLQNFLNSLLERPELRNAKVLQEFLVGDDLKAIYKNVEPKGKSVYAHLEEVFGENASGDALANFKQIEQRQKAMVESISPKDLETFGNALDQYIAENVPLMSKMKYVTFDIAEGFKKMAASIFELNELLSTVLQNQQKLNKVIKLNDKYKVDDTILKLKEGLDGWSTWCLVSKNLVNDHFSNYLHFRKHELMALKELSIMKSSANEQYNNARSSLHSKKIKLFDSRNIEKWGTKSSEFKEPIDEVFKNFNIAEKYILPKEEEKLSKVRELSNFMTNSAYYEYVLFNKRDQRRIVKNFHKYAKKVSKATKNGEAIWNIFEKMKVDENNPAEVGGTGQQRNGNNQNDQFLNGLEDDLDRALQAQARGHGDEGHQGKGFLD